MSATTRPASGTALDCSPAAQDKRRQLLLDLMGKKYSGVQNLSDRGRSVSYVSPQDLQRLIDALQNEMALCDGTLNRRMQARRVFNPPYNKWL